MNETKSPYMQHSRHDDGRTINTKACCCNFYAEVLEKFKSLPKERQIEILKNLFKIDAVNKLDIFPPTRDAVARELMALPSAGGVVRFCDVIDDCEDCPKYGRSCDGDKR